MHTYAVPRQEATANDDEAAAPDHVGAPRARNEGGKWLAERSIWRT